MFIVLWTRDEGFRDDEFRDGDIFLTFPDDWVPGAREKQRFLIIHVAQPWDPSTDAELTKSEYATGAGGEPVLRRQRAYRVDWRTKVDPDLIGDIVNPNATVEPIVNLFSYSNDIARK